MFARVSRLSKNTLYEPSIDYEYLTSTTTIQVYNNKYIYSLYDGHIIEFNRNAIDVIMVDDETNNTELYIQSIGPTPDVLNNVFNSASLTRLQNLNIQVYLENVSDLYHFRPVNIKEVRELTIDSEFPEEASRNEFSLILYADIKNVTCDIYFNNNESVRLNSSLYEHVITVNPHDSNAYYDNNEYTLHQINFVRIEVTRVYSLFFTYALVSMHIVQGVLIADINNTGISSHNICIGTNAGNRLETDNNICIGTNAGSNIKKENNIIICSEYDESVSSDINNTIILGKHDTFNNYGHDTDVIHIHDMIHAHKGKVYIHDALVLGNASTDVDSCNGMLKFDGSVLQIMIDNQWKTFSFVD